MRQRLDAAGGGNRGEGAHANLSADMYIVYNNGLQLKLPSAGYFLGKSCFVYIVHL